MGYHTLQKLIRPVAAAGLFLALTSTGWVAEKSQGAHELRLQVAGSDGGTKLSVEVKASDGTKRQVLLRETQAVVLAGASGSDPAGRTMFIDWSEDSERWFSYSQDGGENWSEPRGIETKLRLHDGTVAPGMAMPAVPSSLELPRDGRLFLVQFRTLSLPAWRQALKDVGVEVLNYFPHNAHIVRMSPAIAARLRRLPFVQRIEPYHPFYRLEPELRGRLVKGGKDGEKIRVNVLSFEWGADAKNRIAKSAEAFGAEVASNHPSGHIIELWVTDDQLRQVAALDDVMWVDRWTPDETDMDLVREDSGANFHESITGRCGQGVNGEVMDVGIQENHQDFDGIILHTPTGVNSHGTSTYGIVFGNGDRDGDGNPQAMGHLPCGQGIYASSNFGGSGRFDHTAELKQAPYFASFQSNSWGGGLTTSYTSISHQMDDIIFRLDMAILQSQSNAGSRNSRPQAWAKNIISVGGIRHLNTLDESDDRWTNGASIGPAADGRIKPDVNYWYDSIFTTTTGNGYTTGFGGTSAATPEVAGILGLMVQMWSENVWGTNPQGETVFERQPHASTIKALLINNAKQYGFSGAGHDLTRTHQGWGRPNVQIAADRAARSFIVDESTPLSLDQTAVYTVEVSPDETELKVTMAYPDPPGTTSATLHRINDLSLMVTSPSGIVYHGNNGLLEGNYSTPDGEPNIVDTVENVFINSPEPGIWTIEVRAAEINQDGYLQTPEDDAVFALVVTGALPSSAETAFADDFEIDEGWTTNPDGKKIATTGLRERDELEATDSSDANQLGTMVSGVNDLLTRRRRFVDRC